MNEKVEFKEVNEVQKQRIEKVRRDFSSLFTELEIYCKPSRETSLAITKLEEAMFWAIKGISREEN